VTPQIEAVRIKHPNVRTLSDTPGGVNFRSLDGERFAAEPTTPRGVGGRSPSTRDGPRPSRRVHRLATDLAFALATPLLSVVGLVVALIAGVLSLVWFPGLALRPVVRALPVAVLPILGAVLFDLAGYWVHRFAHEKAALWRFHSVHHSGEQLDWLSGVRVHPLDGVLIGPPVVLLMAAGFPVEVTGGIAVAQLVIGLFLHANVRWHLRPLQRVVATPDFHHWHHANEPDAIHTNYAAFCRSGTNSLERTAFPTTASRRGMASANHTQLIWSAFSAHRFEDCTDHDPAVGSDQFGVSSRNRVVK
jgi:membrane protein YqaA with SNARE-associated domain